MVTPPDIAIEPARLAEALSAAGGAPVLDEEIRSEIARGAPQIAGRVPLLGYVGWLLKQTDG